MQQPTNDCGILEKQHNLLNIRHLYDIYIYITDIQCFTGIRRLFQCHIMKLCALAHGFCRVSWIQGFQDSRISGFQDSRIPQNHKVTKSQSQIVPKSHSPTVKLSTIQQLNASAPLSVPQSQCFDSAQHPT